MNNIKIFETIKDLYIPLCSFEYSGHSDRHSLDLGARENIGYCGTCNGSNCDSCKKIYSVSFYRLFDRYENTDGPKGFVCLEEDFMLIKEEHRKIVDSIIGIDEQLKLIKQYYPGAYQQNMFSADIVLQVLREKILADDGVKDVVRKWRNDCYIKNYNIKL